MTIDEVHRRIRLGDFCTDLLEAVRRDAAEWRRVDDEAQRLKGLYVAAEVFEYFGAYDEAEASLKPFGEACVRVLRVAEGQQPDEPALLSKRRIWVALAYAATHYRRDDYDRTLETLETCARAVDRLDPAKTGMFATRARVEHARGQVFRQQHRYPEARAAFAAATEFARRRFVARTPDVELHGPAGASLESLRRSDAFVDSRVLADWTIGRCFALGLGWIAYTTGQLTIAESLLSAGYALLRGTGDAIHRAYALLLMGAVKRARAGDDEGQLVSARLMLEDAAKGLGDHSSFALRAAYELALAYYRQPQSRSRARAEIASLKNGLDQTRERSARWMSAALVVESRIERLDGDSRRALALAREAVAQAEATHAAHSEIRAEALIAVAEAHLAVAADTRVARQRSNHLEHAIDRLSAASALARDNPKLSAVCHLHLAAASCRQGSLFDAHRQLAAADALLTLVDHGLLRSMRHHVAAEIERHDCFFVDRATPSLTTDDHMADLEAWLLRQAAARNGRRLDALAATLGVSTSTIKRRLAALLRSNRNVPVLEPPGRPSRTRQDAAAK